MTAITLDDPAAYFDRLAAFEADHWWSASLWRVAAHWLDRTTRGRSDLSALDVGCGAGGTLARLAGRPEFGRVVGVDPSPEALAYARARGRGMNAIALGSALALPFPSETFDLVTCLDVVQHLPDGGDEIAVRELARVLRPGGVAIVRSNAGGRSGIGPRRLRETIAAAGLVVRQATCVNAVGSLAQEARGRLVPARSRPHPEGGGLPRTGPGGMVSGVMARIGAAEACWVGRWGLSLPFGHSAMLLAIKPIASLRSMGSALVPSPLVGEG